MRIKLNTSITTEQIKRICDGILIGKNQAISHITTNSNEVECGDLFVAIKGEKYDGNDYADEVRRRGGIILSDDAQTAHILVASTKDALLKIAAYSKENNKSIKKSIAITGSVGKTTTKEFAKIITSSHYKTHATPNNNNNEIGTAYTLLSTPIDTEILICEMGMNHSGEIEKLSECVRPDIAVITNIGSAHFGNLGSKEQICKAKLEILCGMENGVLLIPDNEILLSKIANAKKVSLNSKDSDYALIKKSEKSCGCEFDFFVEGRLWLSSKAPTPAEHILQAIAYALAIGESIGITQNEAMSAIDKINPNNLRAKFLSIGKYKLYDDTYSSSPESVIANMKSLSLNRNESHSAVLGDMLELGKLTEEMHKLIGKEAFLLGFKKIYAFGVYAHYIKSGAIAAGMDPNMISVNTDITRPDITASQIKDNYDDERILFKASHSIHAERIFDYLK